MNSAQGAYIGNNQAGSNGSFPMMFDPSKYMAAPGPPVIPPPASAPTAPVVAAPSNPEERPPTLGYQEDLQQQQDFGYYGQDQQHQYNDYSHHADGQEGQNLGSDGQQQQGFAYGENQGYDPNGYGYYYGNNYYDYSQYDQQQGYDPAQYNHEQFSQDQQLQQHLTQPDLVQPSQDPGSRPTSAVPESPERSLTAASEQFGIGPDIIANNNHESELVPEDDHQQLEHAIEATANEPESVQDQLPRQGSHAEHYAYYQQFEQHQVVQAAIAPDIISSDNNPGPDRNLFMMQTGQLEREPVDGGNEESESVTLNQVLDPSDQLPIHMDRLVLGESRGPLEQPPSRSEAAGSDTPPPMMPMPTTEERSEAAGSDNLVPQPQPPAQTPTPTASEERSEAAGSDRREIAPVPPNPGPIAVQPPPGRNVTGSDVNSDIMARNRIRPPRLEETDEADESTTNDDNRKSNAVNNRHRSGRHHRASSPPPPVDPRSKKRNVRSPSGSGGSRSSSPSDRESFTVKKKEYRRNERDRDFERDKRDKNSSRRLDDRPVNRSHRYHNESRFYKESRRGEESYRDDSRYHRDYYDDRRSERGGGDRHRRHQDSYSSRPSSRTGYYAPPPHDYSTYYYNPYAPIPAATAPDPKTLEIFKKNWEYYSRNPVEMENLRLNNPQQHANLMRYYQMYSHLLPTITVTERPASRAASTSAKASFQAQFHNNSSTVTKADESSIMQPPDHSQQHYQLTPEVSSVQQADINQEVEELTTANNFGYDPVAMQRLTPSKFASPHVNGIFLPSNGCILKIAAKSPLDGQSATMEFHSIKAVLSRQPGFKELQAFPGPLVPGRTHKGEVIQFCQTKIHQIRKHHQSSKIVDKDSCILMWELMILLLRQKNTIDGSDIAELLLKDRDIHRPYKVNNNNITSNHEKRQNGSYASSEDDGQEDNEGSVQVSADRTLLNSDQGTEKHTAKFRDYLMFGHKKEGLEYAMAHGLWGHALFLASKMDERSYSQVMLRFANGLAVNDPLQTLYQLMSGRQPIAVKECADANWGDWRPHLAMILSNARQDGLDVKSIITLGDTLTERGFLWAGQFCYLVANKEFGSYSNRTSKIVLIGADKSLSFDEFATNEAIQITEIFEYVQKLSNAEYILHSFLYFKFLYAVRLLDFGFTHEALYYLEELAKAITKDPHGLDTDLKSVVDQILYLADRLKYLDPMYTTREGEIGEMGDPDWLDAFRATLQQIHYGQASNATMPLEGYDEQGRLYKFDPNTNAYYYPDQEVQNNDLQLSHHEDYQHVQSAEPAAPEHDTEASEEQDQPIMMAKRESVDLTNVSRRESESSSALSPPPPPMMMMAPPAMTPPVSNPTPNYFSDVASQKPPEAQKANNNNAKPSNNEKKPVAQPKKNESGPKPSIFGRFLGKIGVLPPNQAHLPDDRDNTIVWDEAKKRWVDKNSADDENDNANSAPPSDMELSRNNSTAAFDPAQSSGPPPSALAANSGNLAPPPMPGMNKFAGGLSKKRGALARVDVFKASQSSPALASSQNNVPPPSELFMPQLMPVVAPVAEEPVEEHQQPAEQSSPPVASNDGPVFFNPNSFAAGPAATRRNKYA